jgi:hypothetical protein
MKWGCSSTSRWAAIKGLITLILKEWKQKQA